jgi:Protein of unknown function (DUF1236)
MQKLFVTTAIAASLFFVPAIAWGQAPIEREAPTTKTSNLTLEQRHVIKEVIKDSKIENAPANIQVAVGDTVPQSIHLQLMPAEIGAKVSQIKTHLFFVQGGRVVIVDPKDNKIVDVIE